MQITIYNNNGEKKEATNLTHSELVSSIKECVSVDVDFSKTDGRSELFLRTITKIVHLACRHNVNLQINAKRSQLSTGQVKEPLAQLITNNMASQIDVAESKKVVATDYKALVNNALLLADKLGLAVVLN